MLATWAVEIRHPLCRRVPRSEQHAGAQLEGAESQLRRGRRAAGGWRCTGPDRQQDALDVVRRARSRLTDDLGLEPGPRLRRLETDILQQAGHLNADTPAGQVWSETVAAYGGPAPVTREPACDPPSIWCAASPSPAAAGSWPRVVSGWQSILAGRGAGGCRTDRPRHRRL